MTGNMCLFSFIVRNKPNVSVPGIWISIITRSGSSCSNFFMASCSVWTVSVSNPSSWRYISINSRTYFSSSITKIFFVAHDLLYLYSSEYWPWASLFSYLARRHADHHCLPVRCSQGYFASLHNVDAGNFHFLPSAEFHPHARGWIANPLKHAKKLLE